MTWLLTWTCHICGKERKDEDIAVRKNTRLFKGLEIEENVRYCRDDPQCVEASKTFSFFPEETEAAT